MKIENLTCKFKLYQINKLIELCIFIFAYQINFKDFKIWNDYFGVVKIEENNDQRNDRLHVATDTKNKLQLSAEASKLGIL